VTRKKTSKKAAKKRKSAPSAGRNTSRARQKKKVVKKARTKATKAERRASRPQNRKPQTNGSAHGEIVDLFPCETNITDMTPKQLHELKMAFCRTYATRGIIRDACIASGISRQTYYRWRKKDESFHDACVMAEEMSADLIEGEAMRRAVDGYDKPVIYQGEITDTYTEYSDSLMSMLLRGNKKEKYKERTEHSGAIGRPMTLDTETKEDVVASILSMIKNKPDPEVTR